MPFDASQLSFEAPDPNYRERVRASFARQDVMRTFGIELAALGPGWVELAFRPPAGLTQQDGFLHAGVAATALDSTCGYAALTLAGPNSRVLTSGYKIDLLRPASGSRFTSCGWVVKPGRSLTVACAELVRSDGKLTAIMTATIMTLAGS